MKVKMGPLLKRGRWLLIVSRSIRAWSYNFFCGEECQTPIISFVNVENNNHVVPVVGVEFESEDMHTTVTADSQICCVGKFQQIL